jgi:hypothetical protein
MLRLETEFPRLPGKLHCFFALLRQVKTKGLVQLEYPYPMVGAPQ